MCRWCFYHVLTSSVIYYWTDARQHGIYLFYIITKQTTTELKLLFILKHFNILCKLEKSHYFDVIYCLYKMKQSHWFLCAVLRLVIGPGKSRHCQTQVLRCFTWNENLQPKQNWTAKSRNLKENAGKVKSVFVIRVALWAERLGCCLESSRSWKNTQGKLAFVVNLEAIWFEFWMKGALVRVEIFLFCVWWFSNQFDIVSETIQLAMSCG